MLLLSVTVIYVDSHDMLFFWSLCCLTVMVHWSSGHIVLSDGHGTLFLWSLCYMAVMVRWASGHTVLSDSYGTLFLWLHCIVCGQSWCVAALVILYSLWTVMVLCSSGHTVLSVDSFGTLHTLK